MRPVRLMYITDPATSRHDVVDVARAAVSGGADAVLARGAPTDRALHDLAVALVAALRGRAPVLVSDRLDISLAAGAAGVHLKDSGLPVERVRVAARAAGAAADFIIGISTHDAAGLRRAALAGASPATLGPLRDAPGAPVADGVKRGVGADALEAWMDEARRDGGLPSSVLLLGGVQSGDADLARRAQRSGESIGLASIRMFQDAPSLDEVTARARAAMAVLGAANITG